MASQPKARAPRHSPESASSSSHAVRPRTSSFRSRRDTSNPEVSGNHKHSGLVTGTSSPSLILDTSSGGYIHIHHRGAAAVSCPPGESHIGPVPVPRVFQVQTTSGLGIGGSPANSTVFQTWSHSKAVSSWHRAAVYLRRLPSTTALSSPLILSLDSACAHSLRALRALHALRSISGHCNVSRYTGSRWRTPAPPLVSVLTTPSHHISRTCNADKTCSSNYPSSHRSADKNVH